MSYTPSFSALVAFWTHQREVDRLEKMSDHLLCDIGLRRDQLDLLRTSAPKIASQIRRRPPFAVKPSLQGCG